VNFTHPYYKKGDLIMVEFPPAVINDAIDIKLVSEYRSVESFITNVILPIIGAKMYGIPIPDELLFTADEMLQEYLESLKEL